MNKYEVMYIIDAAMEDSARAELIAHFSGLVEKNEGIVDRVDEWGKRRLAYAINYKTEGYYVLMYIQAESDLPRELERNFQISDSILRSMIIRYEGELPAKREPLKPYVAREYGDDRDVRIEAEPVEKAAEDATEATADEEAPVSEAE